MLRGCGRKAPLPDCQRQRTRRPSLPPVLETTRPKAATWRRRFPAAETQAPRTGTAPRQRNHGEWSNGQQCNLSPCLLPALDSPSGAVVLAAGGARPWSMRPCANQPGQPPGLVSDKQPSRARPLRSQRESEGPELEMGGSSIPWCHAYGWVQTGRHPRFATISRIAYPS